MTESQDSPPKSDLLIVTGEDIDASLLAAVKAIGGRTETTVLAHHEEPVRRRSRGMDLSILALLASLPAGPEPFYIDTDTVRKRLPVHPPIRERFTESVEALKAREAASAAKRQAALESNPTWQKAEARRKKKCAALLKGQGRD